MKIVINALPAVGTLTGVGNYTTNLIKYFNLLSPENSYSYYCGYFTKTWREGPPKADRLKGVVVSRPILKYASRTLLDCVSAWGFDKYDLYFEPNFIPFKIRAKKVVVTVHDFCFVLHPEWQPKDRINHFQGKFATRIKRADRIITASLHVKKEALQLLGVRPEMITPIPLGIDEVFKPHDRKTIEDFKIALDFYEPFFLFVGAQEPRKNLTNLLHAYRELPETLRKEFRLVLVGPEGWKNEPMHKAVGDLKGRVVCVGYKTPREVALLYNMATLFVYPSLYEGFGLPPLEAMACGCPVVVSNEAAMPEVCGDAAVYVDPYDPQSIAGGIQRVVNDERLRSELIQRGFRRSREFTWRKTAAKTIEVFNEVLGNG